MSPASTSSARAAACRQALAAIPGVERLPDSGLSLVLVDGRRARLRFHVEAGWAALTASLPDDLASADPWQALVAMAATESVAKLVLTPGACALELRADIVVDDEARPAPRFAAACDDIRSLAAALASESGTGEGPTSRGAVPAEAIRAASATGAELRASLSETGWSFVERDPERLAIDLALPDRFQQAFITPSPGGRTLVRATLAVGGAPTAASRLALGVLLVTASTVVRLARTAAVTDGNDMRLVVETYLDAIPTAADLDAALGALAAACRIAGRETRALVDERVARIYLAARGWAA